MRCAALRYVIVVLGLRRVSMSRVDVRLDPEFSSTLMNVYKISSSRRYDDSSCHREDGAHVVARRAYVSHVYALPPPVCVGHEKTFIYSGDKDRPKLCVLATGRGRPMGLPRTAVVDGSRKGSPTMTPPSFAGNVCSPSDLPSLVDSVSCCVDPP